MSVVIAIGTHPDDIEIGCGGTIAKLAKQGHQIHFVIATLGEQGNIKISAKKLKNIRKIEAIESAKILGASHVHFLNLNDGLTSVPLAIKKKLITLIRKIKPQIAFIHSQYDLFSDHRITSKLSLAAIQAACGPWYPNSKKFQPHIIDHVFGFEVWNPIQNYQTSCDISLFMNKKLQAVKKHYSQTKDINYLQAIKGLGSYRALTSLNKAKYVEVFEVIKTNVHQFKS